MSFVDLLTSSVFTWLFACFSPWQHLHLSPSNDVLDHTNHIFSESLSSGDDNEEYLQKDKDKDTAKYKVLPRPNVCYIFQRQGVQGFKILY